MPSNNEIRVTQKRQLMLLTRIEQGQTSLKQAIFDLRAEMDQEDVAYVEKVASESLNSK